MEDWPKHKKPCNEMAAAAMKKKLAEEDAMHMIKATREAVTNPTGASGAGGAEEGTRGATRTDAGATIVNTIGVLLS